MCNVVKNNCDNVQLIFRTVIQKGRDMDANVYNNVRPNAFITLQDIFSEYNINHDVSLIKVDIEGGEQFLIYELYMLKNKYNINILVTSYPEGWISEYKCIITQFNIKKNYM